MLRKIILPIVFLLTQIPPVLALNSTAKDSGSGKSLSNSTASYQGSSLKLQDCFQMAVDRSESLKNRKELIEQAKADARAAIGGVLPDVRWIWTDFVQDAKTDSRGEGVSSTLTRKERIEHRFNAQQSLFSGFREMSATKGFRREEKRNELLYKRAGVELFNTVAESFYGVILAETNLGNTRAALKLAQERVADLKNRASLGKTRESEVLSALSQVALLKSEERANIAEVAITREELSFLIGKDVSAMPLEDQLPTVFAVPILEQVLDQVLHRSDIQARKEDVIAKRFSVRYERGGHWPSLNVSANYYTKRVGFQDGIDWDALFTANIPLFQGGTVRANVRRALSELRQAENNLSLIEREVTSTVKREQERLASSIQEAQELSEAYRTAKRSYELQVREYRLGLVNNLEVISALNASLASKQRLDETTIRIKLNYLRLKTAVEDDINI